MAAAEMSVRRRLKRSWTKDLLSWIKDVNRNQEKEEPSVTEALRPIGTRTGTTRSRTAPDHEERAAV
ncbi:unnamed protein product [Nezara viridula]|uniref:Uncharacterized protein n=1 Tax=Nezara viridula TaxID=85310 RepID=A0A9P0HJ07_NEZVI|nr:unnamed protein product [Nezara viridula]